MKRNNLSYFMMIILFVLSAGLTSCKSISLPDLSPSNASASANNLPALKPPQHIALLLPLHGGYGASGQTIREGFFNEYYANLAKTNKQSISIYDTSAGKNIQTLYQQAIAEGADFVIGPLVKTEVQTLHQTSSFPAPTLALNYTEVGSGTLPTNFYEFGLLPEDEAVQMATRARESGLSQAILIAPQNAWGKRLTASFATAWQAAGGTIVDTWYYSNTAAFNQSITQLLNVNLERDKQLIGEAKDKNLLKQRRRQDFDVVFLLAQPREARMIVPLLRYYYVNDIPIYATAAVYSGKPNPTRDVDLNGIIICDIPWKTSNSAPAADRLYAVGQDAYLLSQALPHLIAVSNFSLDGKTGTLAMSPSHQIHRRVPCRVVENGRI